MYKLVRRLSGYSVTGLLGYKCKVNYKMSSSLIHP